MPAPINSHARPRFEVLEARDVPVSLPTDPQLPYGITLTPAGVLSFKGNDQNDVVTVSLAGGQVTILHQIRVALPDNKSQLLGVDVKSFSAASVESVYFSGLGGDDVFTNNTPRKLRGRRGRGRRPDRRVGGRHARRRRGRRHARGAPG